MRLCAEKIMFLQDHDKIALIRKDQQVTYADLLKNSAVYSTLFPAEECQKIAIYSENRLEWVYTFYAGWKNHCIVVPIDFMATPAEVAYMLEDCKPEVIFCSQEKEEDAREAIQSLSYAIKFFVFEEIEKDLQGLGKPGRSDLSSDFPEHDKNDTAVIIYTSGTTGSPKGVMLSFNNLLSNIESVTRDVKIFTPEQRILVLLPLHHIFPMLGTMVMPLSVGGTCIFSPSMASEDILATLQTYKITMILAVPRFYNLIRKGIKEKIADSAIARTLFKVAESVDSAAFSKLIFKTVQQRFGGHVNYLVCGGAAIDNDVARDFKTLGFDLLTGYGMTEAAPMISFTHPGTLKIGASGQILPGIEVKIDDDNEITTKGRNIMQGYYNRPEETADVIKDGWLHTGDLGYVDAENFIFITGRKKEIIVLPNGKNINPEEIEFKILKMFATVKEIGVFMHEGLLQAVISPDLRKMTEQGVHQIEEYIRWDILDKYNHTASPAKKITKFTVIKEELPKTRLGKIRRFQLPEFTEKVVKEKHQGDEPVYAEYQIIKNFLKKQTEHDIYPDDHIEIDLGLDSLDKISLHTFLHSTFGIDMQDEEIVHHLTVGKLAEYVREKKVKTDEEGVNWNKILHEEIAVNLPQGSSTQIFSYAFAKFLLNGYFELQATGLEHVPQSPCIFAPNHQSYIDGLIIAQFFDANLVKKTYFYAEERHFRSRWKQVFADKHNIIIMDINRKLKLSLQKMAAALQNGKNIILFPEGFRTRDGKLAEFKKTFAILSCELKIPVVPVVLQGAYEAMPFGKTLPKFRQEIRVNFLSPVSPEGLSYEALTEKVYQNIKNGLA